MQNNKRIVVSGSPGGGKTSLIEGLKKNGYTTFQEYSRTVIQEGQKTGTANFFAASPICFSEELLKGRKEQFEQAAEDVKKLPARPGMDDLLSLYALYKQATQGDNSIPEPGLFDISAMTKWETWTEYKGMTQEEAMEQYIALVTKLQNG